MYGALLAFKNYNIVKGITGSPWAGFKHFQYFFEGPYFWLILKNTLGISLYGLLVGFPIPIIFALALNEIGRASFKKFVQLVTYAPHFISTVIVVSMLSLLLGPQVGVVNNLLAAFGFEKINFIGEPAYFKSLVVWSDVWQNAGYGAIIYLAALAGIDPTLYEAAKVDGASRWQKIIHVDIPGILPTIIILLILGVGNIMSVGFEKVYLLQNSMNADSSEIIATYVYRAGLLNGNVSYATAVGLFNSVCNLILLVSVNSLAKRVTKNSLW
ncbi:sugar ABC transporter permease [Paenibacillus sp. WST5]|uniref:Sugar ABC transporter permease n=2 Tax=Paenibacillus sedimenti TaxID=2770274 RepID=A0A926QLW0_9BACL|nr:sugar ABC transporter permease [Paenibacillus sedimenti]